MEIKLITGATAFEAAKNTLKFVDLNDFDKENLIVVPDAFSMQAEGLLFDVLQAKAAFNTEIVGISRLAIKILKKHNITFDRASGMEEIFCIFKAIKEEEKNFKYFKHCSVDYSIKILQIIKQFKACKVLPRQIAEVGDDLLDRKMHDLKLIYERYEMLLSEKVDLSKLLAFFIDKVEALDLSNVNLFFVNFDSFSMEINSFICQLAKHVGCVYIGYAKALSPNNQFIFETDILKKTTQYASENGVNVEVYGMQSNLDGHKKKMAQDLFGLKIGTQASDFYVNLVAKNKRDEVEAVAKIIRYGVFKGKKFKDFALAAADKAYFEVVKEVFSKFEIAFYCDEETNLSQTILGSFLLKLLQIAKVGFLQEGLQYLAHHSLINQTQNQQVLHDIKFYNIQDEVEFLERFGQYADIINLIKKLKKKQKVGGFCDVLNQILQRIQHNFENIIEMLQEEDSKKASENKQSLELAASVLEKLSLLAAEEVLSLADFSQLLQTVFESIKVETIPTYIDAVFVGEATESYFQDVDTLFVLGATANALPKSRGDVGILDDEDLRKLALKVRLEPEIKVINRRNRLKIFELLQHANNKLYVSYPLKDGSQTCQKSVVVEDLSAMFGTNLMQTSAMEDFALSAGDESEFINNLLLFVGSKNNLLNAYSRLQGLEKLPKGVEGSLKDAIAQNVPIENKIERFAISQDTKSMFDLKKVSPSRLESYFRCPFVHFVKYILKIEESKTIEPTKLQFGSLQHLLLEKYFQLCKKHGVDVDGFVEEFINENASQFYDEKILKRKYFVDFLKKESKIILKNAKKEQKISDFSPISFEEKVFDNIFDGVNLSGVVDRIDASGEYFRILDYKTGDTQNVRKELFHGKKLQLFLYADAIKRKTGLNLAGVFYFDCQTKFAKFGESQTLFNGLILKDEKAILKTDYRIEEEGFKSDVVAVSKCKVSKKNPFGYRGASMVEGFDDMLAYAKEVSKKAIGEICGGFVQDKPLEGVCRWCAYKSICRHRESDGERKMFQVKEEDFKRKKE